MKQDRPLHDDREIAALVEQFENCTWPYERWNHRAHLAVGLFYARTLSYDIALNRLREHIQRYNRTCGDPAGYHETLTVLFLRRIYACRELVAGREPLHASVDVLTRQFPLAWTYQYYSRERLWSDAARASWLEPDLRPLDFASPPDDHASCCGTGSS
ncbi:MAG: hypothetical protein AB7F89_23515 [Pirellulaceae bacterium]